MAAIVGTLNAIAPCSRGSFAASSRVSQSDRPSFALGLRFG